MPAEMWAFAEKSVEQAKRGVRHFRHAAQQAATAAQSQAMNAQSGAQELGQLAMRYAERNIASAFEFAQKLMHAKDARKWRRCMPIRERPDGGPHRAGQGIEPAGRQGRSGGHRLSRSGRCQALPMPAAPGRAAGRWNSVILCSRNIFVATHKIVCILASSPPRRTSRCSRGGYFKGRGPFLPRVAARSSAGYRPPTQG